MFIKNRKADQGLFIKLVEEIGEVAEQISIRDGRKKGYWGSTS